MGALPSDLPKRLRAKGLQVVELAGWRKRGRLGSFNPSGVLIHHTGAYDAIGDTKDDLSYAKWMALTGRNDLNPPLAQLSISREGVVYILAAKRANHAGKAKKSGPMPGGDGNAMYVGIECMNSGKQGWDKKQLDSMIKTTAVLLAWMNKPSSHVRGHKETSYTGKWDPGGLSMTSFRKWVDKEMNPPAKPKEPSEAIATCNTAAFKSLDSQRTTARIATNAASIVAFQEAAALVPEMKAGKIRGYSYGFPFLWNGQIWSSVAATHRRIYTKTKGITPYDHYAYARTFKHKKSGGKVTVITVHLLEGAWGKVPWKATKTRQAAWVQSVENLRKFAMTFDGPVILTGDFNHPRDYSIRGFTLAPTGVTYGGSAKFDKFYTRGIRVIGHHTIQTPSDHKTLVARIPLKDLGDVMSWKETLNVPGEGNEKVAAGTMQAATFKRIRDFQSQLKRLETEVREIKDLLTELVKK